MWIVIVVILMIGISSNLSIKVVLDDHAVWQAATWTTEGLTKLND